MKRNSTVTKVIFCVLIMAVCVGISSYAEKQSVLRSAFSAVVATKAGTTKDEQDKYAVHDPNRPKPLVITPPEQFSQPPADAIILFNGKDISEWTSDKGGDAKWKVENGFLEVNKTGSIHTKKSFGNCQLHIEWATPADVNGSGQSRGNSGVFLMGKYEIQVLDSYQNDTYADGQAASIYGQYPPIVNACRKPGEWQSYDVSFLRPIFDADGKCVRPARVTILHNGVVVQNNVEIQGATVHKQKAKYSPHEDKLPLGLQDHGNPVRFRNIWLRELPEQPYLAAD